MALNVDVVPGLYYAADSATTIEALKRPASAEPAKAGDAVVAPKQEGAQGVYKVWVSDSPMEADIHVGADGEVEVSWTPDLSDAEPKRHYTVMGKTNLTDTAWVIPVNEEHHFFQVAVTMGEPGLANGGEWRTSDGTSGYRKIGAPQHVAASDGTSATGVTVSWNATPGASGYTVYRNTANNPDAAEIVSSVSAVSFEDTTAQPGTLYFYWVAATNAVSESAKSAVEAGFRAFVAGKR